MAWMRLLFFIFLIKFHTSYGTYKVCQFSTMEKHLCKSVEVGNSNVSCVRVVNSVDCAMKMSTGDADFAVFSPEESLILIGNNNSIDLQVVGEVRQKKLANESAAVSMVVIIRKEFSGQFRELQGKKYCHPGVGISHLITDHFLKYFERVVVNSTCKTWLSAVEQEISSTSRFFGDSCRPGVWAQTRSMDRKLKRDYPNLCSLCDSVDNCKNNWDSSNYFEAALQCLTRKSGEIAYVSLEEANDYFKLGANNRMNNADDYVFLCKNETTMPISSSSPCIWGVQPWNLLVTRKDVAGDLKLSLPDWLISDSSPRPGSTWIYNLRKLLLGSHKTYTSDPTRGPVALNSYIDRGGVDDKQTDADCRTNMRWCTVSDVENEKCLLLSQAASTHGFKPRIECVQAPNLFTCFQRIAQNSADAASIYTEYGYIARNGFGLSTVVYEDNIVDANYQILAVIRKDNTDIQSFQNLRRRKACFPEYNGLGWISFVNIANMNQILGKTCPQYFFGPSCVPGAFKSTHTITGMKSRPQSMCSICPPSNTTDPCPPYSSVKEKNVNAMACLSNGGDVAFVNYKALLSGGDSNTLDERINADLYKVLCKNGTIVQGLSVDDDCALSTGINAEVIGKPSTNVEGIDNSELFLELSKAFSSDTPINMFDEFKGEKKLLFKESTISLVSPDENMNYEQIYFYNTLLANVTGTCKGSAHYTVLLSIELFITTIITWLFML